MESMYICVELSPQSITEVGLCCEGGTMTFIKFSGCKFDVLFVPT